MVEEVKELSAELEAHPFRRPEAGSLEYGEIKVHNALLAQAGIDAQFGPEDKGIGLRETGSIEPFIQSGFGATPRTAEGLERSRRARRKHGLYSAQALAEQKRVRELLSQGRELLKQMQAG